MFKNDTIEKKLAELAKLKDQQDTVEYKIEQLKKELKGDLEERGVEEYTFEGSDGVKHSLSNKTYSKQGFDSTRFKEDHPKLYAKYCTTSAYTRFSAK